MGWIVFDPSYFWDWYSISPPAGILLALGRRSKMTVIRVLCVAFIELFRSVPLITILFMATTMFPLFLPEGFHINKLASAIVAVCLFAAAYMAEDPSWIGLHHEPLFTAAVIFFIGCFAMSKYSQYLERNLGAGHGR